MVLAALAIWFARLQRAIADIEHQHVEIESPFLGKFKTNLPGVGGLFVAACLIIGVVALALKEPDRFPVHGNVMFQGLDPGARDVFIGVVPNSYLSVNSLLTTPESLSRVISVVDGEKSYLGLAYVREGRRTLLAIDGVVVKDGVPTFTVKLEP